jgi:hypothetical protein
MMMMNERSRMIVCADHLDMLVSFRPPSTDTLEPNLTKREQPGLATTLNIPLRIA